MTCGYGHDVWVWAWRAVCAVWRVVYGYDKWSVGMVHGIHSTGFYLYSNVLTIGPVSV